MKKNLGFTRFEFYFVISVISVLILVAIQRYVALAEETRRLSFEITARNFSAAIYNYHARWILAHQDQQNLSVLNIEAMDIQFSETGWPLAVLGEKNIVNNISITSCLSLWQHFLQNPPFISVDKDAYGTHDYHLRLPDTKTCRYEFVSENNFFVDYKPVSGDVVVHTQPFISK